MMEIEFIPLKTPDGVTCGHARVRGGSVELFLRTSRAAQALIWTDSGCFSGQTDTRIRTGGSVDAIALHEQGQLRCCGFSHGSTMTANDLQKRLFALSGQSQKTGVFSAHAPATDATTVFAPQLPQPAVSDPYPLNVATAQTPSDHSPIQERIMSNGNMRPTEYQAAPAPDYPVQRAPFIGNEAPKEAVLLPPTSTIASVHPDTIIKQTFSRLAADQTAAFFDNSDFMQQRTSADQSSFDAPISPMLRSDTLFQESVARRTLRKRSVPPAATKSVQVDDISDTVQDTESFSELLRRADSVFAKITPAATASPAPEVAAVLASVPESSVNPAAMPEPSARPTDNWYRAVDDLIGATPPRPIRMSVSNPFPHIFPNARFSREVNSEYGETLRGTWMSGHEQLLVTAVRGDYSPQPPTHLVGFTRYIRAKTGGYWVRVDDGK
ncbi:MAG: hypothetical protein RRZ24_06950 [Clostridia bacterium]